MQYGGLFSKQKVLIKGILMDILENLFNNYVIVVSFYGWLIAQILKTILDTFLNKKFNVERMVGAGGMPSSHSALVCSMVVAVGKLHGVRSTLFALSLIFAMVVMYDAMGVRRAAGEQAKVINSIIFDLMDHLSPKSAKNNDIFHKKLKELVGHTPLEVVSGMILGVIVGLIIPLH